LKNATVTFTVAEAGTWVDATTGNVTAATTTLTYELFLRKSSGDRERDQPGVDVISATYEGYCISPQALDSRIRQGTTATLSFAGEPTEACVVGDLRFSYGTTGLLGSTLQQVLGDKIRLVRYWQQ